MSKYRKIDDVLDTTPGLLRYLREEYGDNLTIRLISGFGCLGGDAIYEIKKGRRVVGIYTRTLNIDGLEKVTYEDSRTGKILSANFSDGVPRRTDKHREIPFLK
jgi:hypothetical protein